MRVRCPKAALEDASTLLAETFGLDARRLLEGFLNRERLGSTGLGEGVAIPHCRFGDCPNPIGALLTLHQESISTHPMMSGSTSSSRSSYPPTKSARISKSWARSLAYSTTRQIFWSCAKHRPTTNYTPRFSARSRRRNSPDAVSLQPSAQAPTIIASIRIDPLTILPRRSTSSPSATTFAHISRRLLAIVTSSTGNLISPFSNQKPFTPRE